MALLALATLSGTACLSEPHSPTVVDAGADDATDDASKDAETSNAPDGVTDAWQTCPPEGAAFMSDSCDPTKVGTCAIGEECCCGGCHDSTRCSCSAEGEWECYATDICLVPYCGDTSP